MRLLSTGLSTLLRSSVSVNVLQDITLTSSSSTTALFATLLAIRVHNFKIWVLEPITIGLLLGNFRRGLHG